MDWGETFRSAEILTPSPRLPDKLPGSFLSCPGFWPELLPRGDVRFMAFAFTTPYNNPTTQDVVKERKTGLFGPGLGSMRAHVVLYRMCHLFSMGTGWGEESIYLSALTRSPAPAYFIL